MFAGQIVKSTGGLYAVLADDGTLWNCKPRGLFRNTGTTPYVGDYVVVDPAEEQTGSIVEIGERRNLLVRPPVANLDHMVVVVSVSDPLPNRGTLDKFLVIMEFAQIPALLVVTKPDLGDTKRLVEDYQQVGYTTQVVNNLTGEGTGELKELLGATLCAFAGNSGTGKSSLLNALDPALDLAVGETSKKLGRGRHTTRHVEIFPLAGGLRIADTPGFSSLDMLQTTDITAETLSHCFIDFIPFAPECRFRNCVHVGESNCGIKEAVKSGKLLESRYQSYLQIYDEIKDVKEWERR